MRQLLTCLPEGVSTRLRPSEVPLESSSNAPSHVTLCPRGGRDTRGEEDRDSLQKDVMTRSDPHRNQQALTSTKMVATPSPPPAADMDGTWTGFKAAPMCLQVSVEKNTFCVFVLTVFLTNQGSSRCVQ